MSRERLVRGLPRAAPVVLVAKITILQRTRCGRVEFRVSVLQAPVRCCHCACDCAPSGSTAPGCRESARCPGRLKTPVPSRPGRGDGRHSASGIVHSIRVDLALCHRGVTSGAPRDPAAQGRRAASWPRVPRRPGLGVGHKSTALAAPAGPFAGPGAGSGARCGLRARSGPPGAGQPPLGLCILRLGVAC